MNKKREEVAMLDIALFHTHKLIKPSVKVDQLRILTKVNGCLYTE